ncbi:type I polyketide synthase (plasmid) [Streptomyces sp. NBC_01260]|uniref:type I polyketide synthase n=1 Tax=Streptomyces sp. NBC_01260 TaxID=2903801 RepID=UPI002E371B2E|nr:type I polyketide synthase [Streptomyces sp. NBC_01260]
MTRASDPRAPEPIAVIGMACRLPGASTIEELWELLRSGRSAVGPAPAGRKLPGRVGGFLAEVERCDPAFFGIPPREAATMDPQQRLALELAWEALEHAGIVPGTLRHSRTGVFLGAMADDYAELSRRRGTNEAAATTLTGLNRSILANRISYVLGLRGPSTTVDTGQSSSLVSVLQACESLWSGAVTTALAGGVQLNLTDTGFVLADRFGALSPDGRAHTFDARATGYVRGEGGGMVVLRPLERALADGDNVFGVIRGGAVNNDGGGTSLTSPSADAQAELLRAAYAHARVDAAEASFVELHGTGTPTGDPVEAVSLGAVLGSVRPKDAPLPVGSVKTVFGHAEGAAGIAGLLKAVLCLHHRTLTPSLNYRTPHPKIDLAATRLTVNTELRPLTQDGRQLVAGVSSFGMGGTNCHLVLGERPTETAAQPEDVSGPFPVLLSGRTEQAVRDQATRLLSHLDAHPDLPPASVAYALAATRTHFAHRAGFVADDLASLRAGLHDLADGRARADVVDEGTCAFLFTGQGSQRLGMGGELRRAVPAFADAFDAVAVHLDPLLPRPLSEVLDGSDAALLDRTAYTQPALFAYEVALAATLERWGVRPDVLIGHSVGELAAARAAGVLSIEDAATLVAARGRLMQALPSTGTMVAVEAAEAELGQLPEGVCVAAVNGPAATVLSGDRDAVLELARTWESAGRRIHRLRTGHAFHSAHLDPMLDDFRTVAETLTYHPPRVPVVSNLTGEVIEAEEMRRPDYWVRQARGTVRFLDAVRTARARGVTRFLEVGPDAVLSGAGRECAGDDASLFACAGRAGRPETATLLAALTALHSRGAAIDWPTVFADLGVRAGKRTVLPTYAFQRERFWIGDEAVATASTEKSPSTDTSPALTGPEGLALTAPQTRDLVLAELAGVLALPSAARLDTDATFHDLGLDSLGAVELRNRLARRTGRPIPAGLVFDHPTPAAVIDHLRARTAEEPAPATAPEARGDSADDDPVVIVGMACRLPGGVASPEDLWRLVSDGVDAISPFPDDRGWDLAALSDAEGPGGSRTRYGGFLDDVAGFDAGFFGVSPREALAMDPQQRLLLEVSWEALERAGFDIGGMRGSRTGVFTGLMYHDYAATYENVPPQVRGHRMTGGAGSVASGRVAYRFGFEGPAITVDTACSSSLVALHLAVRSVRDGECDVALAGGVTVLSSPFTFVEFSRQGGLSADGRCRSYGDGADGTGWAEGVAVVAVERMSRAREKGHRMLAVVRGSAVNQDGASNGLTAPNGLAQQRVIRAALADAGLSPSDVDVVEGHGTGTALGDPIEVRALAETYGRERSAAPLLLGSVKSNIGHTQAAAGVAGLVKTVLALNAGVVPGSLHADPASPHVDWSSGGVEVMSAGSVPWPESGRPRRAGVSSFGISGTNAHMVLEQAEVAHDLPRGGAPAPSPADETPVPLLLSAHDPEALRARAEQILPLIGAEDSADLAHSLARSEPFGERAVVVGADDDALRAGLAAVAEGRIAPGVVRGRSRTRGRLAVLFTGQGSQRPGMGRELASRHPVFARTLDTVCGELDRALAPYGYRPVKEVMYAPEGSPDARLLGRTGYTQAALFAYEVSLYRLVESWGVRPDVVAGHSIGEVTAAHIAGVLDLADACALVAARGRLMQALPSGGAMLAVEADERYAAAVLPAGSPDIAVAAVNAPHSVVLSGTRKAVTEAADALGAAGRRTTWLDVSHAFHSPLMEPMLADFHAVLDTLTFRPPTIPLVSNVTGRYAEDELMSSPDYWVRHVSAPVRFHDGVRALMADEVTATFEVGPAPVLTALVEQACADEPVRCVPAQQRNRSEAAGLMAGLAGLYVTGAEVDWTAVLPKALRVPLPTYPFRHRRFWLGRRPAATPASLGLWAAAHPLLGARVSLSGHTEVFTATLSAAAVPWLADHVVAGAVVVPGAALVELVLAAGAEVGARELAELVLAAPLVLTGREPVAVQIEVGAEDAAGRRTVTVVSRDEDATAWTRHAAGSLVRTDTTAPPAATAPVADAVELSVDELYGGLAATGLTYGPAFRRVTALSASRDTALADIGIAEDAAGYLVHPVLLDAALHGAGALGFFTGEAGPRLPFSWSGVRVHAPGATVATVRITRLREDTIRVELAGPAGTPVVTVDEMTVRTVPADRLADRPAGAAERPLRVDWVPVDARAAAPGSVVAILEEPGTEPFTALPEALARHGLTVTRLPGPEALDTGDDLPDLVVLPWRTGPEDDMPARVHAAARRALATLQDWLDRDRGTARLVVLTDDRPDLDVAAVRGLVRSAQRENPGRILLVETDGAHASLVALPALLTIDEPHSSLRDGQIRVPRLGPADTGTAPAWRPDGTVLVTGAGGALGDLIARHLVTAHGVRRLVLVSRRGPAAPNTDALRAALTAAGAEVVFTACDVADRAAVADLLAAIPADRPLTGVVHAAGVLDDGVTQALTPERLARVLRPKVDGAWHLHTLTAGLGLDHFVLFSSASGVFGAAGQANYAAANAFLDALAVQRVEAGLPATAMAWAPWREAGMAGSLGAGDLARLARLGMAALSNEQGLALFDAALSAADAAVVPLRIDRAVLAERPRELPSLLRALVQVGTVPTAAPGAMAQPAFADRLPGLSVPEREQAVAALLRTELSTALGGCAVDTRRGFRDLGVDSLIALELRNRLIAETGLQLSTTVVFDYPSPASLAAHITEALARNTPAPEPDDEPGRGPLGEEWGDAENDLDGLDVAELVRLAGAGRDMGTTRQETTA